ncbi:MAG: 3-hydroxyacyl-CoA dehydrogenase NAD-binding domain-containing protein, partial [Ktedonobacteraceae bacterium]
MAYQIRTAAVLGAGVMGAAIAAHLANVGIPSLLLDIVPPDAGHDRDKIARVGLERALKARPASFYSKRGAQLVTIGNVEDDLARLANVDWIIEAVIERPEIKRSLYEKIEQVLSPDTIITSNTSGLPASILTEGRSETFRRHFLITHFFNPVRYMRLLEIVPDAATDPALLRFMQEFSTEVLGKGVVICKDTPNFIANRLGVYGFMSTLRRALAEGYSVGEVDAILGPPMGHPKSAVFRTVDLSGLDTTMHVANNLYENAPNDEQREVYRIPDVMREMVQRGWLGEKSGQGFYKRVKNADGSSTILELNLQTLEYAPQHVGTQFIASYPSLGAARTISDPVQRVLTVLNGDDRAAQLARETTADAIIYAANRALEIADSLVAIDEAVRWGFNYELGNFEMWDALLQHPGILQKTLADRPIPELVKRVQQQGIFLTGSGKHPVTGEVITAITQKLGTFYTGRRYFDFHSDTYTPVPVPEGALSLPALSAAGKTLRDNGSASLIDLGDGVACIEFHTKMNSIDEGIIEMLRYAVEEGSRQFRALVIGNESQVFSAGANVLLVLMGARQGEWKMLDAAINGLQQANQMLKYSPIPVVAAAAGQALGGGCEIIMHAHHTRALAESYIGLVEVGLGLLPAGGGCKELLLRYGADLPTQLARKTGGPFAP